jgi:TPR repeat protein
VNRHNRITLIIGLFACSLAASGIAGARDAVKVAQAGDAQAAALALSRALARQGDATAQADLGQMYERGAGVAQDFAEAANWYRRAAEHGFARAQILLANLYDEGRGVPKDAWTAVKWLRLASMQGEAMAQFELGWHYLDGQGVPQDNIRAYLRLSLAAESKDHDLSVSATETRDFVAAKMSPGELLRAQGMAKHCKASRYKSCFF